MCPPKRRKKKKRGYINDRRNPVITFNREEERKGKKPSLRFPAQSATFWGKR
jgi:hypothetical protein